MTVALVLVSILAVVGWVMYFLKGAEPDDPIDEPVKTIYTTNAWRGESIYLEVEELLDVPDATRVRYYQLGVVETTQPSWDNARVGHYLDALIPSEPDTADIMRLDISRTAQPGPHFITETRTLVIADKTMPETPVMPMYMELTSNECRRAYHVATGDEGWSEQGPITQKYIDMYRDFWIEPTKQMITNNDTVIDQDLWGGTQYSYKALCLENTIAPPLIWAGSKDLTTEHLQKLKEVGIPLDAMFYGYDEAGTGPSGVSVQDALNRINQIGELFPNHKVMQTGYHHPQYEALSNVSMCVARKWLEDNPSPGTYGSCMDQGSCTPTDSPGPRSSRPVHCIEGDPTNDFERSIISAYENGCKYYLYFSGTVKLTTCWEPGGQYNEGGNGDGTQIYFDPATGDPLPSVRMMHYHIALQEVTKRASRVTG